MAPVPASLPSAPSRMSSVFAVIGDKKQIIVYAAIVVIFLSMFLIAVIYILRLYNASSEDEESNTTSTPRPPLRLLLPGMVQQRASSSTSTLVGSVPQQTSPTHVKRSGTVPSPLGQHVHVGPAPAYAEDTAIEDATIIDAERPVDALSEGLGVVVVVSQANMKEKIGSPEVQIDIADNKVRWLETSPVLKVDADVADMMVLTLDGNKPHDVVDKFSDADAINIGNVFLQIGQPVTAPKALSSSVSMASCGAKSIVHGGMDAGPEGGTSGMPISPKSAKCGLLPFRQAPRRGDLWAAALDRLARHVSLENHDTENPTMRTVMRVCEAPDKSIQEDTHTLRLGMATSLEPSIGRTSSSSDDKLESSETSVPAYGHTTDNTEDGHANSLEMAETRSHGKPHKQVRFAGEFKAEVGDHCRVSYDAKAGYVKVKISSPVAALPQLPTEFPDDAPLPHLAHLAELALGPAHPAPDIDESCGSLALSTDSGGPALATESSSEGSLTGPPITPAPLSALGIDDDQCRPIIVVEDHLDEHADRNFYELGVSYSTQALRNLVMKNVRKSRADNERERQEEERRRREEADKVYASFRERRRQRLLNRSPSPAYTPPLTPDMGDSESGSPSPVSPILDCWSGTASPPPVTNRGTAVATDTWTFLPGNTGGDAEFATSSNSHRLGFQVQYEVGADVPLPPRRALAVSPSDEEMKPILVVEDHLDENAERDFYEFGISYSTQALGNLLKKECEKASEKRRLEPAIATSGGQGQKTKQTRASYLDQPYDPGLVDDSLSAAPSCKTVGDDRLFSTPDTALVTLLPCSVLRPHEITTTEEAPRSDCTTGVFHRIVNDSSCVDSEHSMSILDRATRPGRFSKLLTSFYHGYDFNVAAAIAVGLEVNIENCDNGTVLVLSEDDDYPISTVLAEEPPFDVVKGSKRTYDLHLLVPDTVWTPPCLELRPLNFTSPNRPHDTEGSILQARKVRDRRSAFAGSFL